MDWHIGCSGFHYKHWKESFYPKGLPMTKWFDYYSNTFDTLELNVTHYRFPRVGSLTDWYNRSNNNFLFAVKMFKGITHYKKLHDCKRMVDEFYAIVAEGLQEKAACILYQFPPTFRYNETNMNRIVENLNAQIHNVVEFRHESWWNEQVYRICHQHNISFCGISHPDLPAEVVSTTPLLYYRMHGRPRLYASRYSRAALRKIKDEITDSDKTKTAFIYFNNDSDANAVRNASELKEMTEHGKDK